MDSKLNKSTLVIFLAATVFSSVAFYCGTDLLPSWWPIWVAALPILWAAPRTHWWIAALMALIARSIGGLNAWSYHERLQFPLWLNLEVLLIPASIFALAVLLFRAFARQRRPWLAILAFPTFMVAAEYGLSLPLGTFGATAYTQLDDIPVLQIAATTGLWGVSFIVLLFAPMVAVIATTPAAYPGAPRQLAITLVLIFGAVFGYGAWRMESTPAAPASVRVGLIASMTPRNIYNSGGQDALRLLREYAAQVPILAAQGARIVVLPEMTAVMDDTISGDVDALFQQTARTSRVQILVGVLPVRHDATLYQSWGDWFAWLDLAGLAALLLSCLNAARRTSASKPHPATMRSPRRASARRLAISALLGAVSVAASAADVPVTGGVLHGLEMPDGTTAFYAVPYAASPVGSLRWKAAQPVVPWKGTRDATQPPAPCIQHDEGWNKADAATGKEDCLYLSIRVPKHTAKDRLPVFFWIHGGSNRAGDGYGYVSTTTMAQHGVILVAVDYRLGVFGFLGLPELTAESPHHASGDYALTDLVAALKWVHSNIARFGGDPHNVTIGGQSAGSSDVIQLTTSPLTAGLFRGAISESGVPPSSRTATENEKVGSSLFELLHVSGLDALRATRAEEVLAASDKLQTPPGVDSSLLWGQQILDGWVEPLPTRAVYAAHKQAPVPMIVGNNTREFPVEFPADQEREIIHKTFGSRADELVKLYGLDAPEAPAPDPILGSASTQFITDLVFRCPASWVAQQMRAAGFKVWRYQFGLPRVGMTGPAEHSSELRYVFEAAPPNATITTWPPVQQYWLNFIRSGNPNGPGLPDWPDMGQSLSYMSFTPSGPEVGQNLRGPICEIIGAER